MLSFLKNLFKKPEAKPRLTLPSHGQTQPQPAPKEQPQPVAAKAAPSGKASKATAAVPPPKQTKPEKPGAGATPKAKEEWARQAARKINPDATPEQLCGIHEGMTKEEIAAQLAILYRRHNRAASSLEERLREEAEIMLDVIAAVRQKYTDSPL